MSIKERVFRKEREFICVQENQSGIGLGSYSDGVSISFLQNFMRISLTNKEGRVKFLKDNGWAEVQ